MNYDKWVVELKNYGDIGGMMFEYSWKNSAQTINKISGNIKIKGCFSLICKSARC